MANQKAKKETVQLDEFIRNEIILQSIGEGVCVIDLEKRISFANDSALKMLGWRFEDLCKENYEKIFFGETLDGQTEEEKIINPIEFAALEGEKIHVNAETFYRRDGKSFLVEYDCIPLRENENVVGVVVNFNDITERRDLEIAVAEARDAALESAREKANFLANMSHEIRTPLNGIIGITDFISNTNLSIEQKDYIETLKTSANLLLDIVNDILDFSKIEAGKLELEENDFDLREIIAETIKLFIPQAFKKKNKLEFEIEESVETNLCGDCGRLRQILHNLLSNAIKFTEKGKVKLKVLREKEDFLRFEISDTGIGIEESKIEKIFQPFSQADISTTRKFGGTGLGLAISKQLVNLMDGEIGVTSETGKGSKFWFTAKLAIGKNPIAKETEKKLNSSFKVEEIKVLVVEDNSINQAVAMGKLRQFGISADVTEDGLQAIEAVKNKDYDLILMDCRMPRMDGYEATQKIRRLKKETEKIKIIAMTASVTAEERENCLAAGMNDYLAKPVSLESLIEIFEKHFSLKILPEEKEINFLSHPLAEIIDEKTLKKFLEIEERGEKNFAQEMLNLYLKHTEAQLPELKSGFANRNLNIVKNKAHALRGSSGNIGLTDLYKDFNDLERLVETDWLAAEKILNIILEKFRELKEKVSQISEFGDL